MMPLAVSTSRSVVPSCWPLLISVTLVTAISGRLRTVNWMLLHRRHRSVMVRVVAGPPVYDSMAEVTVSTMICSSMS